MSLSAILLHTSLAAQVRINEILASNATVNPDPDYGNYCDWIELYNESGQSRDLGGYYLSDDREDPTRWQFTPGTTIPPQGYLLVYADGTSKPGSPGDQGLAGIHANFRLTKEGETLYLFDAQLQVGMITLRHEIHEHESRQYRSDGENFHQAEHGNPAMRENPIEKQPVPIAKSQKPLFLSRLI